MFRLKSFGARIAFGFFVVSVVFATNVSLTLWKVDEASNIEEKVNNFRVPTTRQSLYLLNGINHSIAALRGWILIGDEKFKIERQEAIDNINSASIRLNELFTKYDDINGLQSLKLARANIDEMSRLQDKAQEVATNNKSAALALMQNETAPIAFELRSIVEEVVSQQDQRLAADILKSKETVESLNRLQWILLITGLMAASLIGLTILRDVTRPIAKTIEVSERIARQDFEFEVELKGPTEIGVLNVALETMRQNLKSLTSGLLEKNRILENKQWLIDGQVGLLESMSGDQNIKSLANSVLSFLSERTGALMASFYLRDGEVLRPIEGLAHQGKLFLGKEFRFKEGLIGQAAHENKLKIVNEVPSDYFRVHSGFGDMVPKSLVLMPVSFDYEVVAMMEFASQKEFNQNQIEFLSQVDRNIGIAVNLSLSTQKTKELLEETQVQAEELQSQQEELRASNEELELKTKSLEASEEELRSQQEELRSTNEELEEQTLLLEQEKSTLNTRTGELENAQRTLENRAKEVEQVSKYKSEFLANMSHELRTPLNSILMLSQTLSENRTENLSAKQIQAVNTIHSSGGDLLDLIEDILDLSKVEAGKLEIRPEEVSIVELCGSMEDMFVPMAKDRELKYKIEIADNLPKSIYIDPTRIKQVLKNLLSNAFKFTNEGEVSLSVFIADKQSQFYRPANASICFGVKDTGIGIPTEAKNSIFEAFKQLDAKTTRKYGGTGLGLSIVKELVALLGGSIHLDSLEGEGTEVTLVVPISYSPSNLTSIVQTESSDSLRVDNKVPLPLTLISDDRESLQTSDSVVLIVEDDLRFANSLLDLCRECGFKGVILSDGASAVKLAEEMLPQGILLDLSLPELDGTSVLKLLKENISTRHIPVQVITGHDRQIEVLKAGAFGFLKKPAQSEDILKALKKMSHLYEGGSKYVLVVEDDDIQRRSIREFISLPGIEVLEADTGEGGLNLLKNHEFGCIILDLKLPDMTGKDFLERAKNNGSGEELPPVIIYTGRDLDSAEIKDLERISKSIIVKGAKSPERLFDETMMFLHRLQKDLPDEKKKIVENLHDPTRILKSKVILVVDDDPRNILSIRHLLEDHGVVVLEAENGRVALEQLVQNESKPDLILMDMMMPEMDGYEAVKHIRKNVILSKIPVVAITARAMRGEREKCIDVGCNDYLSKPIDNDKLLSLLRVWLYRGA